MSGPGRLPWAVFVCAPRGTVVRWHCDADLPSPGKGPAAKAGEQTVESVAQGSDDPGADALPAVGEAAAGAWRPSGRQHSPRSTGLHLLHPLERLWQAPDRCSLPWHRGLLSVAAASPQGVSRPTRESLRHHRRSGLDGCVRPCQALAHLIPGPHTGASYRGLIPGPHTGAS